MDCNVWATYEEENWTADHDHLCAYVNENVVISWKESVAGFLLHLPCQGLVTVENSQELTYSQFENLSDFLSGVKIFLLY